MAHAKTCIPYFVYDDQQGESRKSSPAAFRQILVGGTVTGHADDIDHTVVKAKARKNLITDRSNARHVSEAATDFGSTDYRVIIRTREVDALKGDFRVEDSRYQRAKPIWIVLSVVYTLVLFPFTTTVSEKADIFTVRRHLSGATQYSWISAL